MYEEWWRKAYEMGYYYGRLDEMNAKPYDSRTPSKRGKAEETEEDAD